MTDEKKILFCDVLDAIYSGDPDRINEASLGRVWQHWQASGKTSFAIVSAWKDNRSKAENEKATKELEHHIKSLGYGYSRTKGVWKGGEEPSRVVVGMTKDQAVKIATKFDQESVLYVGPETDLHAVLISQDGSEEDKGLFHPQKEGDSYTKVGHKTFVFEASCWSDSQVEQLYRRKHGDPPPIRWPDQD